MNWNPKGLSDVHTCWKRTQAFNVKCGISTFQKYWCLFIILSVDMLFKLDCLIKHASTIVEHTASFVSLPAGSSSPRLLVLCGNKNDGQCYQLTSNRFLCSLTNATKSKILQKKVLRIWHFLTQRKPGPRMWHRCYPYPTRLWSNLSLLNKLIYGNTIFACRYTINMDSIFGLYAFDINFWMTDACFRCWT